MESEIKGSLEAEDARIARMSGGRLSIRLIDWGREDRISSSKILIQRT